MAGNNPIYYWDTCIFLAWLRKETTDFYHASVITYTEITSLKMPAGVETMLEEVLQRPNCAKLGVDMRVAKLARDLRNYYVVYPE